MKTHLKKNIPNYRKIYTDMLNDKYPDKMSRCRPFLEKEVLTTMDIITLNVLICSKSTPVNQKFKSYDRSTILQILRYQRKNNLTNIDTARHFNLSRNTVQKWKKTFLE